MLEINSSEFRSDIKTYLNKAEEGEVIRVTKYGKPIADLVPIADRKSAKLWKQVGEPIRLDHCSFAYEVMKDRSS